MMPLSLSLFPDLDLVDGVWAESLPWLAAWAGLAVLLSAALLTFAVCALIDRIRNGRSPVAVYLELTRDAER